MSQQKEKIRPFAEEEGCFLPHATLISMIEGSIGTTMFQQMFFEQSGEQVDALRNGDLSCAVYVSFLLHNIGLVKEPHTFVTNTVEDMKAFEWIEIEEPLPGAVLVWERQVGESGESHPHIGFSLGGECAVSNNSEKGMPLEHHWTYGKNEDGTPVRRVTGIYWHPSFDEELKRKQGATT